jgi:hypothetical protein
MDALPDPGCRETEARYANFFEVGHNAYEFLIEFGQYRPKSENVQPQARIVTGPVFAKLLLSILTKAVAQFEEEHGAIQSMEEEVDPLELVRQSIKGYEPVSNSSLRAKRREG